MQSALSERFRVVLPDLPLHGDSEDRPFPSLYAGLVCGRALRLLRPDVLGPRPMIGGHGAGAEILAARAAGKGRLPRRASLILMPSRMHRAPQRPQALRAPGGAGCAGRVPGVDRLLTHGACAVFTPDARSAPVRARNPGRAISCGTLSPMCRGNPTRAGLVEVRAALAAWCAGWSCSSSTRGSTMPALLLWADRDRLYPLAIAEEALALLPDGQLRVLLEHRIPDGLRRPRWVGAGDPAFCGRVPARPISNKGESRCRQAALGGETTKAVANFPISGETVPLPGRPLAARLKGAAAAVNGELGLLPSAAPRKSRKPPRRSLRQARRQFPIDVFQTGSGPRRT